jgi:DNA repair protein RecO
MHHIYHTEGIILGSKNFKEASKYFYILTCDLGLVYAEAQGIRKISSKLRFVLQEFNYVKLDFVQRKNIWRITNAVKTNELEDLNKDFTKLKIVANIARLLLRLLPGIESNPKLFGEVLNGFYLLEKTNTNEELKNIEIVLVLRILNNLGYIGENFENLTRSPLENELLTSLAKNKLSIIREINKALRETGL